MRVCAEFACRLPSALFRHDKRGNLMKTPHLQRCMKHLQHIHSEGYTRWAAGWWRAASMPQHTMASGRIALVT